MNKEEVYKNIQLEIDNTFKYYLDLQDYIEELLVPKVDYSFLLKNMSLIYSILTLSKGKLDDWYKTGIVSNYDYIHNYANRYKDNYYRINNNESFVDSNINAQECNLFFSMICIPWKIEFISDSYTNILLIKELLNYVNYTSNLVLEEDKKYQKAD